MSNEQNSMSLSSTSGEPEFVAQNYFLETPVSVQCTFFPKKLNLHVVPNLAS
jgi:hypothetical protein